MIVLQQLKINQLKCLKLGFEVLTFFVKNLKFNPNVKIHIFNEVKKAIAIFFCLQIFSGNTFAMEIMKLPFLVQHYFEHEKADHPDLGFGTFLWEHYVADNHEDENDGHCDENMPFKHCHDCCTHVVSAITCLIPENSIVISFPSSGKEVKFLSQENFHSFYHCCIWQPPKLG